MKSALIAIIFTLSSVIITNGDPKTNQGACGGGNKLLNGATLLQSKELKSCNGKFRLKLTAFGELRLYNKEQHNPIWHSGEPEHLSTPYTLVMQEDNNLVVYQTPRDAVWSTGTNKHVRGSAVAIIQNDGNFVVYGNHGDDGIGRDPQWSTNTGGK